MRICITFSSLCYAVIKARNSPGTFRPYNHWRQLPKMLAMSDLDPGMQPGNLTAENEYSALDIAKLCGYSSDRWTRDRRQELEAIFTQCKDGSLLISRLKSPSGRYSPWALEQIQSLQRSTSTAIPVLKNGQPVLVKGRAKLQSVERKMTLQQYTESLIEEYGKAAQEEDFDPEDPDGIPGGSIEAELVEEDPELISTKLVFQADDKTAEIAAIQDDTAAIAGDAFAGLNSFEQNLINSFGSRGFTVGSLAMQQYAAGIQKAMNQGATDLHSENGEQPAPKTARKTTRKKS